MDDLEWDPSPPSTHETLQIPSDARNSLLPSPELDIWTFLNFPLPPVAQPGSTTQPTASFSLADPTLPNASSIRKLLVPTSTIVQDLYRGRLDAARQGLCSIRYVVNQSSAPVYIPLWVLTFWDEVIRLRAADGAYTHWKRAEEWLRARRKVWNTKKPSEVYSAVEDTYMRFSTLPWSGTVRGFDNQEPLHTLATYATHRWLSDVQENQMLDLLRIAVSRRPEGHRFEVENIAFWKFLKFAYEMREKDTYHSDRYFVRPKGLGDALVSGVRDVVVMIINLSNVHWVAAAVNFREKVISYGDSLGSAPHPDVTDVLEWWTATHTGQPFLIKPLPITRQPDYHSCGLMSWNALAHYLLPDLYPLLDSKNLDAARLDVLHAVIDRHLDEVSAKQERQSKYHSMTNGCCRHPTCQISTAILYLSHQHPRLPVFPPPARVGRVPRSQILRSRVPRGRHRHSRSL